MTADVRALMSATVTSAAGPRDVELAMPAMRELVGLFPGDGARDAARLARVLPLVLESFVSRLDGREFTQVMSLAAAEDAQLARALLQQIRAMLDALRERGRVFALCPHCGRWEAEVGMTAYALTIAEPLPSTFDGLFLATPWLATDPLTAVRPALPRAARIRVEAPSLELGLPSPLRMAALGEIDRRADPLHGPAWTALARLGHLLEPVLPDDQLEALPAVDFFFVDLIHYLVDCAPVRPETPGGIRCARCSGRFLPVRRDAFA